MGVATAYTGTYPRAVVVMELDTTVAYTAMKSSWRFQMFTSLAIT
jgi:hypothetical protein